MLKQLPPDFKQDKVEISRPIQLKSRIVPPELFETDLEGTILDKRLQETMGYIDLEDTYYIRDRKVSTLYIPRVIYYEIEPTIAIDNLTFQFNYLLIHLQRVKLGKKMFGYANKEHVQKIINSIISEIAQKLTGKWGLLRRHIAGTRVTNSGRAVAIHDPFLKLGYVGIPSTMMRSIGVNAEDYVLLIRHPVLWENSILVAKALPVNHNCISCHSLYCRGLGLDFDGDCVTAIKIPHEFDAVAEKCWIPNDKYFMENAQFMNEMKSLGIDPQSSDSSLPFYMHIFTIRDSPSLDDFIDPSSSLFFSEINTSGKRSVLEYMHGLNKDEYISDLVRSVADQATIKLMLPLAGAFSAKLRFLAEEGASKELSRSANALAEIICQQVLDAKHHSGEPVAATIIDAFEGRNNKLKTAENVIAFLEENDIYKPVCEPIIRFAMGINLTEAIKEVHPAFTATEGKWDIEKLDAVISKGLKGELSSADRDLLLI